MTVCSFTPVFPFAAFACRPLPATLKDDRTTLTQWTEIQTDKYPDSIVQTTGRQLMPTASCFNFFPTAQKFKIHCQPALAHLALPLTAQADPMSKAKRANFATAQFENCILEKY